MARPLRIEFPGAFYHVTSRGNARGAIFLDDVDHEEFLWRLGGVVREHRWLCHAYCLMTNHFHLLLETPEANLSRGMRRLNGAYSQHFNRRHMPASLVGFRGASIGPRRPSTAMSTIPSPVTIKRGFLRKSFMVRLCVRAGRESRRSDR